MLATTMPMICRLAIVIPRLAKEPVRLASADGAGTGEAGSVGAGSVACGGGGCVVGALTGAPQRVQNSFPVGTGAPQRAHGNSVVAGAVVRAWPIGGSGGTVE